jgi:hypothetical protein
VSAPEPALISTAEAARRIGWTLSKFNRRRREASPEGQRLRACIHRATARSTDWHVGRLRKAGFILEAAPTAGPDVVRDFTATLAWGGVRP